SYRTATEASPDGTASPSCDGQVARSIEPPGRAGKLEKDCRRFSQMWRVFPRTDAGRCMEKEPFASGQRSDSGFTTLPPAVTPTTRPEYTAPTCEVGGEIVYAVPLPSLMLSVALRSRLNDVFVPSVPPYEMPPDATPTARTTGSASVSSDAE